MSEREKGSRNVDRLSQAPSGVTCRGAAWTLPHASLTHHALLSPQQMERILKKASKTHKQRVEVSCGGAPGGRETGLTHGLGQVATGQGHQPGHTG